VTSDPSRRTFLGGLLVVPAAITAWSSPAWATQDPAPPVMIGEAQVEVELPSELLVGEQVVVAITLRNSGATAISVDDLASRPWLVEFELDAGKGGKIRRATAAPAVDPGGRIELRPASSRRVLLEIPSAGATVAGSYTLSVRWLGEAQPREIHRRTVRFAAPEVVKVDLGPDPVAGSRSGLRSAWLHRGASGFELFLLQQGVADEPGRNRHLLHLDQEVQPLLAASRTAEAATPVLAWELGPRAFRVVGVEETGLFSLDQRVDLPWPKAELIGRPVVVAGGMVGVPLWIPDPTGPGGDLRVALVSSGAQAAFPRLSRMAARPTELRAVVDASGAGQLLVRGASGMEMYLVRELARTADRTLPLKGKRLWAAVDGESLLSARFAVRPKSADGAGGGLALLAVLRKGEALIPRWLDLQGNTISEEAPIPGRTGGELLTALPSAVGRLTTLWREKSGLVALVGAEATRLGPAAGPVDLVVLADGTVALRSLSAQGKAQATALSLPG